MQAHLISVRYETNTELDHKTGRKYMELLMISRSSQLIVIGTCCMLFFTYMGRGIAHRLTNQLRPTDHVLDYMYISYI